MTIKLFLLILSMFIKSQSLPRPVAVISREMQVVRYQPQKQRAQITCYTVVSNDPLHPAIMRICEVEK